MNNLQSVRIDKWLWAARFFKTRALASKAVSAGHVHINGERIKPSRKVVIGDSLVIRRQLDQYIVVILLLADKRGSSSVAQTLYDETPESIIARESVPQIRQLNHETSPAPQGRPDKRSRRLIHRFNQSSYD